jgi:hypothetical protein
MTGIIQEDALGQMALSIRSIFSIIGFILIAPFMDAKDLAVSTLGVLCGNRLQPTQVSTRRFLK